MLNTNTHTHRVAHEEEEKEEAGNAQEQTAVLQATQHQKGGDNDRATETNKRQTNLREEMRAKQSRGREGESRETKKGRLGVRYTRQGRQRGEKTKKDKEKGALQGRRRRRSGAHAPVHADRRREGGGRVRRPSQDRHSEMATLKRSEQEPRGRREEETKKQKHTQTRTQKKAKREKGGSGQSRCDDEHTKQESTASLSRYGGEGERKRKNTEARRGREGRRRGDHPRGATTSTSSCVQRWKKKAKGPREEKRVRVQTQSSGRRGKAGDGPSS